MYDAADLMKSRHSVRQFTGETIPPELRGQLNAFAEELNEKGDLRIRILFDEPVCFSSRMAKYGRFENCRDYIAMIGRKAPDLEERCGYWGEKLVLKAQELGLNTCWAAMTHGKSCAAVEKGEKEVILIALGYGKTQGVPRKSKTPEEVSNVTPASPEWFRNGIDAALLAPTAVNQQNFRLILDDSGKVYARSGRIGPCLKIDLGIVKCHFELGAGKENFEWA